MNNFKIRHTVTKEDEGRYYTITFPVPEQASRVTVTYQYAASRERADGHTVIDLGLMDADQRFLGWSGSARNSVYVGETASTPGYLKTTIRPGEWSIIVGAYRVPKDGVQVEYTVAYTKKQPAWYFGDLHMHSDASDGQHSIYELIRIAKKRGLDFIAVSNHNNYSENLNLPEDPALTLIPAVEWTHYRGHFNFFGPRVPFKNSFVVNTEKEMLALVEDARAEGALVSINHPKCRCCPYLWQSDRSFDSIEVWNGPMRQANLDAIAWWDSLLRQGRKIPLVGGSDFHRNMSPVRLGHPVTAVFANSRSVEDLLAAVRHGHGYVTSGVHGVCLTLDCRGKSFGDTVERRGAVITCRATHTHPGMRLELVTDEGTPVVFHNRRNGTIEGTRPVGQANFAYLVVTRRLLHKEWVCAISNPIYFR